MTQARAALAICYGRAGRLEDAKAALSRFVPSEPPAELAHATTYWLAEGVLSKDPTWARQLFESLTKEEPLPTIRPGAGRTGLVAIATFRRGRLGGDIRAIAENVSRRCAGAGSGAGARSGLGNARSVGSGVGDV